MPGTPSSSGISKTASNAQVVHGFRAENELRDLQFKLTHQLQSTLDVHNTLEMFYNNISGSIKLDGLQFELEGDEQFSVGKKANHRAQYNIKGQRAALGSLTFFRKKHFLEGELAALEMFVGILFYPLRNALLYREALASSLRDSLTGIGNRNALDIALSREIKLAHRHEHSLCMLFIDIDHFKQVNDLYGHRSGDRLLQHCARCIQSALRDTDQIFRYGGEEFVVILNNTDINAAQLVAERIRLNVAMTPLTVDKQELSATVSLGVSTLGAKDDAESLLKRSDSALYIAKNSGRNKVVSLGLKVPAEQDVQAG